MRKLPPLNAVKAFEAAARHLSLTKAAEELFVTHGAVSKQISTLEAWLGAPLFLRTKAQIRLTDAGRNFLAATTPALDRISVIAMQILEQAEPGTLRINAPPTFTMRWLIPRISAFQRRRSGVEIKLTTSTAAVDFSDGAYDIAIRGALEPSDGMVSRPFMTETIVPICHPDLLERGRLDGFQDLEAHTLISYDTEPLSWSDWLGLAGLHKFRSRQSLQFEQMYFALQAAVEGLGVVLVPLFLVADDIIAGRLCAPFGLKVFRRRRYYAHFPFDSAQSLLYEGFSEWLFKEGQDTEHSIDQFSATMNW